jgi:hypothetical protein
MSLTQLRRFQWAVRATLAIGVAASVCANVLHARDNLIAQTIAAWPPLALLLTVELVSRVPVHRRGLAVARICATATIAGIAAFVSYFHMAGVAARYGETGLAPFLLPLSVDGLVVVASVSLVELAGRVRAEHIDRPSADTPELIEAPSPAEPIAPADPRGPVPAVGASAAADAATDSPLVMAVAVGGDGGAPNALPVVPPRSQVPAAGGTGPTSTTPTPMAPSAIAPDLAALLPAARVVRDELRRRGRSLTRASLAAGLRNDGHTIGTDRVSALLSLLKNATPKAVNGRRPGSDG